MKQRSRYKRLAKAVGIIMVVTAVAGFIALKDAERVARSAWQTVYMVFILTGGIFNLSDNGNDSRARCACFSYVAALLLSVVIGITFRGGIHTDFFLIFIAFLISLIRLGSIFKEKKENRTDADRLDSPKPIYDIHHESNTAIQVPSAPVSKQKNYSKQPPKIGSTRVSVSVSDSINNDGIDEILEESSKLLGEHLHKTDDQLPELYEEAIDIIFNRNQASASLLQRYLKISFRNACDILDYFESCGIIGKFVGSSPRKLLASNSEQAKILANSPHKAYAKIDIDQILKDEAEWRREQMGQSLVEQELDRIDKMDGHTFERWCASLLEASGFKNVKVTRGSGDQGVDVLATLDGVRYAVQCKCYASDLGNKPIQEVYAGIAIYKCQLGSVMTNRRFTSGAKTLAEATGISLWDRDWIVSLLEELDDAFPL